MNRKNLDSFLTCGYFFKYDNKKLHIDLSGIDREKYKGADENELINESARLWRESIAKDFTPNRRHLVPISGGLDSRAILAALLEHVEASQIQTYTFGSPNTLDYEIGNYIAKKLGTVHTAFDLTAYDYTIDELFDIAKRIDYQTHLFHHPPVRLLDEMYGDSLVWSGFLGDRFAGSYVQAISSKSLEEAKESFVRKNRYVRSCTLSASNDFYDLLEYEPIDIDRLSIDEQIEYPNRSAKYVAPHVLMEGYEYSTPFLYQPLIDFMLSIEDKHRKDQSLYRKMLLKTFPKEFSYKTKNNLGLPLSAPKIQVFAAKVAKKIHRTLFPAKNSFINYVCFNTQIRQRPAFTKLVKDNVCDLKSRNIINTLDIEKLFADHMTGKGNYGDALVVLTSLEIFLKAGFEP